MRIILSALMFFLLYSNLFAKDWQEIGDCIYYAEFELSKNSEYSDSRVTIIKIDSTQYDFGIYCETEYGPKQRNAEDWVISVISVNVFY